MLNLLFKSANAFSYATTYFATIEEFFFYHSHFVGSHYYIIHYTISCMVSLLAKPRVDVTDHAVVMVSIGNVGKSSYYCNEICRYWVESDSIICKEGARAALSEGGKPFY